MNFKTLSPHLKLKNIMSQSLCLTTKHVLQNSRRKILPTHIYPKIYHICCSPFISHVSCFPLPSFPCFPKNFTAASSSDISHIFSIILSLHLLKLRSKKYYTFYYLTVSWGSSSKFLFWLFLFSWATVLVRFRPQVLISLLDALVPIDTNWILELFDK